MEEKMMNIGEEVIDNTIEGGVETTKCSTTNVLVPMLIGSGLAVAAIAVAKKVKKVWAERKAKKALEAATSENDVETVEYDIESDDDK